MTHERCSTWTKSDRHAKQSLSPTAHAVTFRQTAKPGSYTVLPQPLKAEHAPCLRTTKLHSAWARQARWQDSGDLSSPRLLQRFPLMLVGRPLHLWPAGMVVGTMRSGCGCGEGGGVLGAMTFSHTTKPVRSSNVLQEAKAAHMPLRNLYTANLHMSSDRHAALQASGDNRFPSPAQVLPSSSIGRPAHIVLSGMEASLMMYGLGAGVGLDGMGVGAGVGRGSLALANKLPHKGFFVDNSRHISPLRYFVLN